MSWLVPQNSSQEFGDDRGYEPPRPPIPSSHLCNDSQRFNNNNSCDNDNNSSCDNNDNNSCDNNDNSSQMLNSSFHYYKEERHFERVS